MLSNYFSQRDRITIKRVKPLSVGFKLLVLVTFPHGLPFHTDYHPIWVNGIAPVFIIKIRPDQEGFIACIFCLILHKSLPFSLKQLMITKIKILNHNYIITLIFDSTISTWCVMAEEPYVRYQHMQRRRRKVKTIS